MKSDRKILQTQRVAQVHDYYFGAVANGFFVANYNTVIDSWSVTAVLEISLKLFPFLFTTLLAIGPAGHAETPDTTAVVTQNCPSQTGIYFSDHGSWKEMEQVRSLGVHTTGVAKTAFTYGIASGKVKATFPDPKAPVQIADERPLFCSVNVAEQGRDIIVVKLEPHGAKREIQLASLRAWSGVNMQYKDSDMVKVEVQKQNTQTFLVTTPEALKSGEYIMFPRLQGSGTDLNIQKAGGPTSIGGYDFGYRKSK